MDNYSNKRRNIFVGLFIASATAMLGMGIILPILPQYAQSIGASGFMVGLIFAGYAISRGVFSPIIGQISDVYGRKKLIALGLALNFFLSLGYVIAFNPVLLTIIRIVQGLASAMITPLAQSYVGDIVPAGKEGAYMNLFYISFFGGTAVGPVLGGYLSTRFSLAFPFYTMAGVTLLAFLLVLFLVPESNNKNLSQKIEFQKAFGKVLKEKKMWGLMSYISSRGFYRWGFNSFFPIYAVNMVGLNNTEVGLILSGYMAMGGLLQYPFGKLVDKYPEQRNYFIVLGGLLSAVFMLIVPFFKSLFFLIIITLGMGIASAFSRSAAIVMRTRLGTQLGMGNVIGTYTMSMSVGQVLGPLIFGVLVDFSGVPTAFYCGGFIGLAGVMLAYFFLNQDSKREYE